MDLKIISSNRKAYFEYTISETVEAGVALTGTEVKSARAGKVNLTDGWVEFDANGEAILRDVHISKYSHGTYMNHEETRPRKLLLNKKQIAEFGQATDEKGYTVVPLKMYFKDQYIKVEIGLAKSKHLHDKRGATKAKEAGREMARALRQRR